MISSVINSFTRFHNFEISQRMQWIPVCVMSVAIFVLTSLEPYTSNTKAILLSYMSAIIMYHLAFTASLFYILIKSIWVVKHSASEQTAKALRPLIIKLIPTVTVVAVTLILQFNIVREYSTVKSMNNRFPASDDPTYVDRRGCKVATVFSAVGSDAFELIITLFAIMFYKTSDPSQVNTVQNKQQQDSQQPQVSLQNTAVAGSSAAEQLPSPASARLVTGRFLDSPVSSR